MGRFGSLRERWLPVLLFVGVGAVLVLVAGLSVRHLPLLDFVGRWRGFPDNPWLDGLTRWDGGWYEAIARRGYWLEVGRRSPVAFFPVYPLLMRAGAHVVGHPLLAGIAISAVSGLVATLLLHRWAARRLAPEAATAAVVTLLVYPFALFLYGVVYSDALFLALALGSFTLLDRGHPWLAGLTGAVASATRPVGLAVLVGLVACVLERRGVFGRRRAALRDRRLGDLAVLLAGLGFAAYCAYLWIQFGDPLAFKTVAGAPGWEHEPGPATWFKVAFFRTLGQRRWGYAQSMLVVHAAATALAFALLPAVVRRFGLGYGVYAFVVLAIPATSSKDFFGMGRYVLAAFPCFAAAGAILAGRPRLAAALVVPSALALLLFASLFARWYYVS